MPTIICQKRFGALPCLALSRHLVSRIMNGVGVEGLRPLDKVGLAGGRHVYRPAAAASGDELTLPERCRIGAYCMKRCFRRINHYAERIENIICNRLLNWMDGMTDKRICGASLVPYVPSIFRDDRNGVGGTGTQSTRYIILKRIFSHVQLSPSDTFLDVGCGKGRVLAFLIREKCPCQLYGIEHNEEVGKMAAGWAKRYDRIHIAIGDALQLDYDPYTVLSLARSFLPRTFLSFVERCEDTLTHPITLIYWYDQQSGHLLRNRPGWEMQMRGRISRIHGIKVYTPTQFYSIWKYDPAKRAASHAEPGHE